MAGAVAGFNDGADWGWLRACPLRRHVRLRPDKVAVTEFRTGLRLTYAELDEAVGRAAHWLREIAPEDGARVAFLGRNALEQVLLFYACARAGRVFVPLNWRLSGAELKVVVEDCAPAVLIHQPEFAGQADQALAGGLAARPLISEPGDSAVLAAIEGRPSLAPDIEPGAPTVLLYTSGTTGRPKGVVWTQKTCVMGGRSWCDAAELDSGSAMLLDAPLFHVIGLMAITAGTLFIGGAMHISDGFDPAETLRRLGDPDLRVTHYFGVPQMAQAIAALPDFQTAPMPWMRGMFSGGAPLPPALIETYLRRGLPLVNGYGMTEIGSAVAMPIDVDLIRRRIDAVGVTGPTFQMRIGTVDGAEPGKPGEILMRAPTLTPGYWRNPEATAQALGDGWIHTGDVGAIDADGFIRILGRSKDMFISGGENVYPAEVEAALSELPAVAEVAVIGVEDQRWGEVGAAFVVRRPGAELDVAAVTAFCRQRLAGYKRPAHIRFVDSLPRNGAGKVMKEALRTL
jgi:fatty-acyl-CoA synthase